MKRKNLKKAVSFMLATLMAASAMTQALAVRENPPSNAHIDSSWTMYLVPNAHIDTAWQWPYEDTARDVIRNIVIGIIVVISVLLDVVVRSGKPRRKKEKSSSEVKSKNVGVKA